MPANKPFLNPDYNLFRPGYWFGQVDARPISIFRIFYALFMLRVAAFFLPLSQMMYSDNGIFSRSTVLEIGFSHWRPSLMMAFSQPWMVQAFFTFWILVLLLLLFGWKTRLMTILHFILILSVHNRNPYVLNAGDTLMRLLAFWMMFIPVGKHYAIDALLERVRHYNISQHLPDLRVKKEPRTVYAFPVRMIQLQVALVYLFSGLTKLPGGVWLGGDAVSLALQLETFQRPLGRWVVTNTPYWLMQIVTWATVAVELLWTLLVFAPFLQPLLRRLALFSTTLLHSSIALLMAIQNFLGALLSAYIMFLQPRTLKALDDRLRVQRAPTFISMPANDSPLWYVLAQTTTDRVSIDTSLATANQPSGVACCDAAGNMLTGWEAWRTIYGHLPLSRLWLWLLRPTPVRQVFEAVLSLFARGLQSSAPRNVSRPYATAETPAILRHGGRAMLAAGLGFLMVLTFQWCLTAVRYQDWELLERPTDFRRDLIELVGLRQSWRTFAPIPSRSYGPIVIEGTFGSGDIIDLRTGLPVGEEWALWKRGPNTRWRKYEEGIRDGDQQERIEAWVAYYCDYYGNWQNHPQSNPLTRVEMWYYFRRTLLPEEIDGGQQEERRLYLHWCLNSIER